MYVGELSLTSLHCVDGRLARTIVTSGPFKDPVKSYDGGIDHKR